MGQKKKRMSLTHTMCPVAVSQAGSRVDTPDWWWASGLRRMCWHGYVRRGWSPWLTCLNPITSMERSCSLSPRTPSALSCTLVKLQHTLLSIGIHVSYLAVDSGCLLYVHVCLYMDSVEITSVILQQWPQCYFSWCHEGLYKNNMDFTTSLIHYLTGHLDWVMFFRKKWPT